MKAQILSDLNGPRAVEGDPGAAGDGRRLRRDRNREAVVDALLALYGEGQLDPSAGEVAARAGLSPRSLFRYFADVDDLCRAAVARQLGRVADHAVVDVPADASLPERIATLAERRCHLYETIGPVGLVSRLRAPFQPVIAEQLTAFRALLRDQLATVFAPELDALRAGERAALLGALDVLCSYESHHLLRTDQAMSPADAEAAVHEGLTRLLTPAR